MLLVVVFAAVSAAERSSGAGVLDGFLPVLLINSAATVVLVFGADALRRCRRRVRDSRCDEAMQNLVDEEQRGFAERRRALATAVSSFERRLERAEEFARDEFERRLAEVVLYGDSRCGSVMQPVHDSVVKRIERSALGGEDDATEVRQTME
eukprot:Hpha_TRINITY_DN32705_c0_g1::TRINITY_DN32705_c0_g1_i1::g.69287::m.69287